MKVTIDEIIGLIEGLIESDSCMGSISDKQVVKALELVARIKAHGIEQPSIDALIAEIDSVDNYLSIQVILNKYRGQK